MFLWVSYPKNVRFSIITFKKRGGNEGKKGGREGEERRKE